MVRKKKKKTFLKFPFHYRLTLLQKKLKCLIGVKLLRKNRTSLRAYTEHSRSLDESMKDGCCISVTTNAAADHMFITS